MILFYLMADTYKVRKAMASWRRPPGRPRNVWLNKVHEDANGLLLSTQWRSPWVTERRNGSLGLRDDDEDDDDDEGLRLVSKMEGKTNFSRHIPAVRDRFVECLEIIDVGCNLKQCNGLIWRTLTPLILRQICH